MWKGGDGNHLAGGQTVERDAARPHVDLEACKRRVALRHLGRLEGKGKEWKVRGGKGREWKGMEAARTWKAGEPRDLEQRSLAS